MRVFSLLLCLSVAELSAISLFINNDFTESGVRIGDSTDTPSGFGSSGLWLATDDGENNGSGAFGDQWVVSGNGVANLAQDVSTEAQALIQWVDFSSPGFCEGHGLEVSGSFSMDIDWNTDPANTNYNVNEIDLRLYVVAWNDASLAPLIDSQNPNVGAGDEFDLRGGVRLDGMSGDAPLILIDNNTAGAGFSNLTPNNGVDTVNINLTESPANYDNLALVIYGEAAGASFDISNVTLEGTCLTPEPTTTTFIMISSMKLMWRRRRVS